MIPCPDHLRGKVHRYYLAPTTPGGTGGGDSWSLWLLDQETGSLSIVSDYGNWAHRLGRCGFAHADFRIQFLGLYSDYVRRKLASGVPKLFDEEATKQAIEKAYWEQMGTDVAFCKDDDLERATSNIDGEVSFAKFVEEFDEWDFSDCAKYTTHESQWLDHLMTVTLPRVRAAIQAELEAEAGGAQ